MQATHSRRSCQGLTLVEVTIVLLVLAIVGALAVPMIGGTADTKLRAAARLFVADVDYARIQSITHADAACMMVFDKDGTRYHLALASEPDTPLINPATGHDYITRFGAGRAHTLTSVRITEHNLDDGKLAFGIYGQLEQTDPAEITLAVDNRRLTLTIDPVNGEVTMGEIH